MLIFLSNVGDFCLFFTLFQTVRAKIALFFNSVLVRLVYHFLNSYIMGSFFYVLVLVENILERSLAF